jgi:hypothetical protein
MKAHHTTTPDPQICLEYTDEPHPAMPTGRHTPYRFMHTVPLPRWYPSPPAGLCWSAVLAGVLLALGAGSVLQAGLHWLHLLHDTTADTTALNAASGVATVLAVLMALGTGSWCSARLAGPATLARGLVHAGLCASIVMLIAWLPASPVMHATLLSPRQATTTPRPSFSPPAAARVIRVSSPHDRPPSMTAPDHPQDMIRLGTGADQSSRRQHAWQAFWQFAELLAGSCGALCGGLIAGRRAPA